MSEIEALGGPDEGRTMKKKRPLKFSIPWARRQARQRVQTRAAADASAKWTRPSGVSASSKRELDELLRDLGGEA